MVHAAVQRALRGSCFFVAPPRKLRIEHAGAETVRWEIFCGQLLDPAHTRSTERFASWHAYLDESRPAAAPLLSIRWQCEKNTVFVTRQILCHGFQAYEDEPGVILSRPVEKWVSELVGTIDVAAHRDDALADELRRIVFLAVVGTSRLPITSLETPLPAFSLGRLAYLPLPDDLTESSEPWTDPIEFLAAASAGKCDVEHLSKALETVLRAEPPQSIARLAGLLEEVSSSHPDQAPWLATLFRAVFNGMALSPYTHFADAMIGLIRELADAPWFGPTQALDLLGYMLRNLCRHLTAFDLTLFHNFGANYPDALFLEALLDAFLKSAERNAEVVFDTSRAGRLRRRAVRQAALIRRHYEGHPVPDAPTSMGENARVLPEPFLRVPEEQIVEAGKRRRKLFTDQTTDQRLGDFGRRMLEMSLADLDEPHELRELGMAVYLDRPLGVLKQPGEVDRTPLFSYEAFSRSIARRRIKELARAGWIDEQRQHALCEAVDHLAVCGVPVASLSPISRPGVVSIADTGKAAADFVLLRTIPGSLVILGLYDWQPLIAVSPPTHAWFLEKINVLFVQYLAPERTARPVLRAYCGDQLRLELGLPEGQGPMSVYELRGGVELAPLQVLKVIDSVGQRDVADQSIRLRRRVSD